MNLNTLSNVKVKAIKSKEIREDQTQIKPNIQHALQYNHSDIHMFDLFIFYMRAHIYYTYSIGNA